MPEPKILIWDVETMANLAWVWGKYQQDVIAYQSEWHMLCFTYRWLGEKKTHYVGQNSFPKVFKKDPENDKEVIKALHAVLDEADITIAHNGNAFDIKKANSRFLFHGMEPPSPYKTIDTLKEANSTPTDWEISDRS